MMNTETIEVRPGCEGCITPPDCPDMGLGNADWILSWRSRGAHRMKPIDAGVELHDVYQVYVYRSGPPVVCQGTPDPDIPGGVSRTWRTVPGLRLVLDCSDIVGVPEAAAMYRRIYVGLPLVEVIG